MTHFFKNEFNRLNFQMQIEDSGWVKSRRGLQIKTLQNRFEISEIYSKIIVGTIPWATV